MGPRAGDLPRFERALRAGEIKLPFGVAAPDPDAMLLRAHRGYSCTQKHLSSSGADVIDGAGIELGKWNPGQTDSSRCGRLQERLAENLDGVRNRHAFQVIVECAR